MCHNLITIFEINVRTFLDPNIALSITGRLQRDQEFSIPGFPGWNFAKSWDPGIFWDGINLKFLSRDFTKKVWDLSGFPYQLINLVNFIHFGGLICL